MSFPPRTPVILLLLVLVVVPSLILAGASPDPCAFRSSKSTGILNDFSQFKGCAFKVAFNRKAAAQTLETLRKGIQPFAFLDIVRDTPPTDKGLDHIAIDLAAELDKIDQSDYLSDFDFHNAVSDLFLQLKDPHTLYVKPTCLGAHLALQPFSLTSRIDSISGAQVISIDGLLSRFVNDGLYKGIPLRDLVGADVLKLNGVDALKAIVAFTARFGYISKDRSAAFNQALNSDFQRRYLGLYGFPSTTSQIYTVQLKNHTVVNVEVPWAIYSTRSVTFSSAGCTASSEVAAKVSSLPLSLPKLTSINFLDEFKLPKEDSVVLRDESNQKRGLSASLIAKYPSGSDVTTAQIASFFVDNDTIALKISTFSPDVESQFLSVLHKTLTTAESKEVKNLIVDVIGNGGGSICLGYKIINQLVSERNPEGTYDIIHSNLTDALVQKASKMREMIPVYGPSFWSNKQRKVYSDSSWYEPGIEYSRGGKVSNYSQRVFHACDYDDSVPTHKFQRILILSDGLCGSTCAVFSSHLDEVEKVDTVALGGIISTPNGMQYFSFPGGQVLELDYIFQLQDYMGIKPAQIPRFPNDATFRFAAVEIYPWLKGKGHFKTPLEFVYRPAQYRVPLWLPSSVEETQLGLVYQETAKIFDDGNLNFDM